MIMSSRSSIMPLAWRTALLAAGVLMLGMQLRSQGPRIDVLVKPSAAMSSTVANASVQPQSAATELLGASYPAIAAHPLFDASREPWAPPALPPAAVAIPPPPPLKPAPTPPNSYTLVGLVSTGAHRTALLRHQDGRVLLLTEGQELDGWQVRKIEANRVQLESEGSKFAIAFPTLKATGRPGVAP